MLWVQLSVACIAVIILGILLSHTGDKIARAYGLSHAFVGLLLFSTITSLPELVTSFVSIWYTGSADYAFGNIFGSNMFNLFILAVMGLFTGKQVFDGTTQMLKPCLQGGVLTLIPLAGLVIGQFTPFGYAHFSWLSLVLVALVLFTMKSFGKHDHDEDEPDQDEDRAHILKRFLLLTGGLVAAGIYLIYVIDNISESYDLNKTFAGTLFIAVATSLPELAVSVSSFRVEKGGEMALGNVLGSNVFNLLILALSDLLSRDNIFYHSPFTNLVAATLSLALILLVARFIHRPSQSRVAALYPETWLITVFYISALFILYLF